MFKMIVMFMSINGQYVAIDSDAVYNNRDSCRDAGVKIEREYGSFEKKLDVRTLCKRV